jgi:hypothetical protein
LKVATPFVNFAVAVIVIGLIVGIFVLAGTMTFQDVKLTVTVPVGFTPVPLFGATVTVREVLTTCAPAPTMPVVAEFANAKPTPDALIVSGAFTALLDTPIWLVSVPCSPAPGLKVTFTRQVPPTANGLPATQPPLAVSVGVKSTALVLV